MSQENVKIQMHNPRYFLPDEYSEGTLTIDSKSVSDSYLKSSCGTFSMSFKFLILSLSFISPNIFKFPGRKSYGRTCAVGSGDLGLPGFDVSSLPLSFSDVNEDSALLELKV